MIEPRERPSLARSPRPIFIHRAAIIGAALAIVVAATLVASALAGSAPATTQQSAPLWLNAPPATLSGHDIAVIGGIAVHADLSGAKVKIFKREVGESGDTLVGEAAVSYDSFTGNVFQAVVPAVARSCVVSVRWDGNADYLAASTWMFAGVAPQLTLKVQPATRKKTSMRITVSPEQPFYAQGMTRPPFIADVQCRLHGVWTRFPADLGVLSTNGKSWCAYDYFHVKPGAYVVRARFLGTNYNVASVSRIQHIVVP